MRKLGLRLDALEEQFLTIPPLKSLSENSPSEILHSLQKGKLQLELKLGNKNEIENENEDSSVEHHSPLERRKNQGSRDSNQVFKQQAASGSSGFGSRLPYEVSNYKKPPKIT